MNSLPAFQMFRTILNILIQIINGVKILTDQPYIRSVSSKCLANRQ